MGRYSYRLQPGARLAPNRAGFDPLTTPAAFNRALRSDLEALFVPGHPAPRGPEHEPATATAAAAGSESSAMPASDLSHRISLAVGGGLCGGQPTSTAAEVPDLRALHRRLPRVESKTLPHDDSPKTVVDNWPSCSRCTCRPNSHVIGLLLPLPCT